MQFKIPFWISPQEHYLCKVQFKHTHKDFLDKRLYDTIINENKVNYYLKKFQNLGPRSTTCKLCSRKSDSINVLAFIHLLKKHNVETFS